MFIENPRLKARDFLESKGRKLDLARFDYIFGDETGKKVLKELSAYQNEDGGFGNGLYPDIIFSGSSPYTTAVAFRIMNEIKVDHAAMAFKTFTYLKENYDPVLKGWSPLPKEAISGEKSPWWDGSIPFVWAVPTVEIVGYFHQYRESFVHLDELTEKVIDHINTAEHLVLSEVFAYLSFYDSVSESLRTRIAASLKKHATTHVSYSVDDWEEYGNLPALFVSSKDSLLYSEMEDYVNKSFSYLIDTSSDDGVWLPDWYWGDRDKEAWEKAEAAWIGDLTVRYTYLLKEFAFI